MLDQAVLQQVKTNLEPNVGNLLDFDAPIIDAPIATMQPAIAFVQMNVYLESFQANGLIVRGAILNSPWKMQLELTNSTDAPMTEFGIQFNTNKYVNLT